MNQVLEAWDDDEHWEDAMEDEGYEPMELCEEEGEPEGCRKLSWLKWRRKLERMRL